MHPSDLYVSFGTRKGCIFPPKTITNPHLPSKKVSMTTDSLVLGHASGLSCNFDEFMLMEAK